MFQVRQILKTTDSPLVLLQMIEIDEVNAQAANICVDL